MRLIDFEYASYNFRSFDHANHFCEWMYNYDIGQAPYYSYEPKNWPTDAQICNVQAFLRGPKEPQ